MIGPIVGKAFVTRAVPLFDDLDQRNEISDRHRVGIEQHDRASDDCVDLGPVDTGQAIERGLHLAHQPRALGAMRAAHLDVCATAVGRDRQPALAPPFRVAEPFQRRLNPWERIHILSSRKAQRDHRSGDVGQSGHPAQIRPWNSCCSW